LRVGTFVAFLNFATKTLKR